MSQIKISGLTFGYEGSADNVFENISIEIDTNWKLGLIGRNGKGKTTLLRLLQGKEPEYRGSISADTSFDYFPYEISEDGAQRNTIDIIEQIHPDYEFWKICRELELLRTDAEVLYRAFGTLSHGERAKIMLAVLFSRDNYFLLIDEPTNHLDEPTRELLRDYLNQKKGFILVSHDRWLLDGCVDHVLALERDKIEIEKGNFSSWWENKERRDRQEQSENEKLKREIGKLQKAADRTRRWADQVERTKIGFDPTKEHDRSIATRACIGEKSRKMQQRRKNLERRQQTAISGKEQLLRNVEEVAALKLNPLQHHKEVYVRAENFGLSYGEKAVLAGFSMELKRGDRIVLQGKNGSGKSSIIKAILQAGHASSEVSGGPGLAGAELKCTGKLAVAAGLQISYVSQDTSCLKGSLEKYIEKCGLDESLFKAILRQIGFERIQFEKQLEEYSQGQKKKVLIAAGLLRPAHLYIWDEPLNYIDVFSRMQIERLILQYQPTMLFVEHDRMFSEKCATAAVLL